MLASSRTNYDLGWIIIIRQPKQIQRCTYAAWHDMSLYNNPQNSKQMKKSPRFGNFKKSLKLPFPISDVGSRKFTWVRKSNLAFRNFSVETINGPLWLIWATSIYIPWKGCCYYMRRVRWLCLASTLNQPHRQYFRPLNWKLFFVKLCDDNFIFPFDFSSHNFLLFHQLFLSQKFRW